MIPRGAALFGILGLVPFLALSSLAQWPVEHVALGWLSEGNWLLLHYATVIFCFMGGVLWGFATRSEGAEARLAYGLAVLPAIFAMLTLLPVHDHRIEALLAGFLGLLALDFWFWNEGLAPVWWMRFRVLLSLVVLASLIAAL